MRLLPQSILPLMCSCLSTHFLRCKPKSQICVIFRSLFYGYYQEEAKRNNTNLSRYANKIKYHIIIKCCIGTPYIEHLHTFAKLSWIVLQTSNFGFSGPPYNRLQSAAAFIKSCAHWSGTKTNMTIQHNKKKERGVRNKCVVRVLILNIQYLHSLFAKPLDNSV